MSEFKGTRGNVINGGNAEDGFFISCTHPTNRDIATVWKYDNTFLENQEAKANANLIIDAFKVRQAINCELSELKEQRDEMLAMLENLVNWYGIYEENPNPLHPDNVLSEGSKQEEIILATQQLIKKVKNNE
jgi:hypothetical protein